MPTPTSSVAPKCKTNDSPWQPPCLSSMSIHLTALRLPIHEAFGMEPGTPAMLVRKAEMSSQKGINFINYASKPCVFSFSVLPFTSDFASPVPDPRGLWREWLVAMNVAMSPGKRVYWFFFMRCVQARKTEFKKCQCETTMQMKMLGIFWSISQWPLIDYTFNANITIFGTFQMISILKRKLSKQATLCP